MERHHHRDDDKFVIVLRILNGVHFVQEKPCRKITVNASLDHNVLETATSRPTTAGSGTATFNSTLVWVCDRYSIKRMKMENIPIKVECFEVLPGGERCPIGRVVIALRSVKVVPLSRTKLIKPRWYRLANIDSQLWRNRKPELNIEVMITDPTYLATDDGKDSSTMEGVSGDENHAAQQTTIYANPATGQLEGNAELLEDRGLLQIGRQDEDDDLFHFVITLKCGRYLDRLASGSDTIGLRYQLFGDQYSLHAERKEPGSAIFYIQEKISINVRSSLTALGNYLENDLKITVDVLPECDAMAARLHGQGQASPVRAIGTTTIDFVGFLKEKDLGEFKRKYASKDHTMEAVQSFPVHAPDGIEETVAASNDDVLVPSLDCKFSLRFLRNDGHRANEANEDTGEERSDGQSARERSPTESRVPSPVEREPSKTEGITLLPIICPVSEKEKKSLTQNSQKLRTPSVEPPAAASLEKVDIESILLTSEQDLRDIRRTFAFCVRVGQVKFTTGPSPGMWQLTLQHPKADTPFTKLTLEVLPDAIHPERIDFGDVTLKLLFSTLPERVMEVIGSEPSKLTLNGPHGTHALARLDNTSLLVGTRERQPSGVVVMVNGSTGENVAIATVGCTLEEVGLNYNSQLLERSVENATLAIACCCSKKAEAGGRPVGPFDETIAYQLLEEQKTWMNKQREQFLAELKEKERNHLQLLSHDWKLQRTEEEKRLAVRLAHADAIAAALEQARRTQEDCDQQGTLEGERERLFREQLEAIRAKALRLEEEAEAQIEATRKQCRELQDELAALSQDHRHVLDINLQLQRQLKEESRCRAQEVSELQQRVEKTDESKLRYKEEWAKMTRKVHQLEEELAVARTPYYQSSRRENRKAISRAGTSQMSMISRQRGGGDDCSSCNFSKPDRGH